MKKSNINTTNHNHSFLFWLIVPIVLAWLSINYVIGSIRNNPMWDKNGKPTMSETSIPAYSQTYPKIQTSNRGYLTLWFDDAWLSQYTVAYSKLSKLSLPAAIAVPTNAVESKNYMNWAQLRVLQDNGWEITNHSSAHDCTMQTWTPAKINTDLIGARNELWRNKLSSDIFVSPCGVDGGALIDQVKEHFLAFRVVDPGNNDLLHLDPYHLKTRNIDYQTTVDEVKFWVSSASANNEWVILVFHQIGQSDNSGDPEGGRYSMNTDNFSKILDYIKQSGIEVVVPSQILNLVQKK